MFRNIISFNFNKESYYLSIKMRLQPYSVYILYCGRKRRGLERRRGLREYFYNI